MKRLLRPLGALLAAAVAAAAVAATPPSAIAAAAPGDPFGPAPLLLANAEHKTVKSGEGQSAAVVGDRVVFRAGTPTTGQELWVTDGTPGGTRLLADIWPGASDGYPVHLTTFGDRVFFSASDGVDGAELWVTDGTTAGTKQFADLLPGPDSSRPTGLVVAGSRLYLAARDLEFGVELWVSDGTVDGTRVVDDLVIGLGDSDPRRLTAFGSKVVFQALIRNTANDGNVAKPLLSDGRESRPVRLDALPQNTAVVANELVPLGGRLFLGVSTAASGTDLWVSGGAPGDALLVKDINPGGDDSVGGLTVLGDRLIFTAGTQGAGQELWTSDGTPGGTQLLRDIKPGPESSSPTYLQVLGGRAWFVADDGVHGRELWSTDGTAGGTVLHRDVVAGAAGSDLYALGVSGARAVYGVDAGGTGSEPWVLEADGRFRPLGDLLPGPTGSDPEHLATVGNTWVFAATGPAGPGIWAANLQSSSVQAKPKRAYSAKQARTKRVVVKVVVEPAVSGVVAILRKGRVVGRAEAVNGVAKVRIRTRLTPGRHRLSAVYRGSVRAQASTPDRFQVRVLKPRP